MFFNYALFYTYQSQFVTLQSRDTLYFSYHKKVNHLISATDYVHFVIGVIIGFSVDLHLTAHQVVFSGYSSFSVLAHNSLNGY